MVNSLSEACKIFSLVIGVRKAVARTQNGCTIMLGGNPLDIINYFCYLASTILSSLSLDGEMKSMIGRAATTFEKLTKSAWNSKRLCNKTKMRIYKAITLLFLDQNSGLSS